MKITAITPQKKDKNRINIMVDGSYRFSLDVFQYADLGIKIGKEYSDEELRNLEQASLFGKIYTRSLEYCLIRPHSAKEIKEYLYRKTLNGRNKQGDLIKGISPKITSQVFDRLLEKGYIDDIKFSKHWIENRKMKIGVSSRKIRSELLSKGVERYTVERLINESSRNDKSEIEKVILKKRKRYSDDNKFINYLINQGFSYETIKTAMLNQTK